VHLYVKQFVVSYILCAEFSEQLPKNLATTPLKVSDLSLEFRNHLRPKMTRKT